MRRRVDEQRIFFHIGVRTYIYTNTYVIHMYNIYTYTHIYGLYIDIDMYTHQKDKRHSYTTARSYNGNYVNENTLEVNA